MFFPLCLNFNRINVLLAIVVLCGYITRIQCDLVILNVNDNLTPSKRELNLCAIKKQLNDSANDYSVKIPLIDASPYNGCKPLRNETFANKTVFMRLYNGLNCTLNTILLNLQANNARLAIIGSNGPIRVNLTNSLVRISPIFMPVIFANRLENYINTSISPVIELSDINEKFDLSVIFIWFIAVFTVMFGSLWSSYEFKKSLKRVELNEISNTNAHITDAHTTDGRTAYEKNQNKNEAALLKLSYAGIFILLVFVIAILLLLYFFYNVIIYFVYVIFLFGATTSMYRIGCLFFNVFNCATFRIPENNIPLLKARPQIIRIILAAISITLSVLWFVYRHKSWIWILQNILALSLTANALSFYRLSSYRIVTFILVLFFLYDVFMVFISPYITQGTSIMEAVAFGGRDSGTKKPKEAEIDFNDNNENVNRLPVVVIIPRMSKQSQLCSYYLDFPYSLLGLGDMLIPGLSVNYAILFDITSGFRYKIYFIANIIAYGLGLFLAFIGLIFMNKAQPALFYLCPAHLIITLLVALIRKEFKSLWSGEPVRNYTLVKGIEQNSNRSTNSNENLTINCVQQQQQLQQQELVLPANLDTINEETK